MCHGVIGLLVVSDRDAVTETTIHTYILGSVPGISNKRCGLESVPNIPLGGASIIAREHLPCACVHTLLSPSIAAGLKKIKRFKKTF